MILIKYKTLQKFVQWEPSCSMRTVRRTDGHDEAKVGCRNFTNEDKNLVGKPERQI